MENEGRPTEKENDHENENDG